MYFHRKILAHADVIVSPTTGYFSIASFTKFSWIYIVVDDLKRPMSLLEELISKSVYNT